MSRWTRSVLVVALLVVAGAVLVRWAPWTDDGGVVTEAAPASARAEHRFVVPAGTHERIAAGEDVDILPRTLRAEVGETIEIVNEDDTVAQVGVFVVGPGETVRQRFNSQGVLEGICDVHPDGRFTIEVT